jgi:hypothetical protein
MIIKTNNIPRHTIDAYQLTDKEKSEFDYIDFSDENCSNQFFRYKGNLYDLSEAMRCDSFGIWQGIYTESAFSGVLVRSDDGFESVIVASYYC